MFETDGIPGDWAEKCNEWVDEVWLPSEFNRQTFAAHGVDEARLQLMPQPLDLKLFDADAVTPAVLPHRPRFAFLSVFKWEKRKGWDALFAAFLREFTASEDVALFLRVSTDDGNKQELADALHAELCRLADDATTEAEAAADTDDAAADADATAAEAPEPTIAVARRGGAAGRAAAAAAADAGGFSAAPPATAGAHAAAAAAAAARHADAAARRPRHAPARPVALVRRIGSRQFAAGRGTAALAAAHAAAAVAATGPAAGPPSAEPPAPPAAEDADDGDDDGATTSAARATAASAGGRPMAGCPATAVACGRARLPTVVLLDEMLPGGELPGLYAAVDAFVLPSRGEGWGRPVAEAMAMRGSRDRHQLVRDHRLPRRRSRVPAAVHAPARAARRRPDVG